MCPPESADKCDCSIYDDDQDLAKNSSNIYQSVFERFSIISSGGIGGFENIDILGEYISTQKFKIFGEGLGISNIQYSPQFSEITKQVKDGSLIYRNPGQIVSFNNLYANLYFSGGIVGVIIFLIILKNIFSKILISYGILDAYLLCGFFNNIIDVFLSGRRIKFTTCNILWFSNHEKINE